jgi:hypothetical protein
MTKLIAISAITTLLGIAETLAGLRLICAGCFQHMKVLNAGGATDFDARPGSCWHSSLGISFIISSPFVDLLMQNAAHRPLS